MKSCPVRAVGNETFDFLDVAELYLKHGLPPVAGGQLDQTRWFLDAVAFLSNERASWRAERTRGEE